MSASSNSISEDARKQTNLRVLQRSVDATIANILGSATYVVLYRFESQAWQKAGVEGSLFLVSHQSSSSSNQQQSLQQHASLVVLNRTSPNNWIMPITSAIDCQTSEDYVMLRQGTTIHGVWFHNGPERTQVTRLLQEVISDASSVNPITSLATPTTANHDNKTTPPSTTISPSNISPTFRDLRLNNLMNNSNGPKINNIIKSNSYDHIDLPAQSPSTEAHHQQSSKIAPQPVVSSQQPLDKKSLQLALLSLIQDDRFLDLIHAQYIKVVHARASKQQNQTPPKQNHHFPQQN